MQQIPINLLKNAFSNDSEIRSTARNEIVEIGSIDNFYTCVNQARMIDDVESLEFWLKEIATSDADPKTIATAVIDLAQEVLEPNSRFVEGLYHLNYILKLADNELINQVEKLIDRFSDLDKANDRIARNETWRNVDLSKPMEKGKSQQEYYERLRAYFTAIDSSKLTAVFEDLKVEFLPVFMGFFNGVMIGLGEIEIDTETVFRAFRDFQEENHPDFEIKAQGRIFKNESEKVQNPLKPSFLKSEFTTSAKANQLKVKDPTWKSFRQYWNDCETVITPILNGFVDIEGGHLGIAGRWLPSCSECFDSISCTHCGRTTSNYIHFRAGDGDGVYGVFEMWFDSKCAGALVLMDPGAQFANSIINSLGDLTSQLDNDPESLIEINNGLYNYFYETFDSLDESLNLISFTQIEVEENPVYTNPENSLGILILGEAGEGIDSDQSLVTVNNLDTGLYNIFLFGTRDIANENIIIPRVALILNEDISDEIGLNFGIGETINLADEYGNWSKSSVFARFGGRLAEVIPYANFSWWQNIRRKMTSLNDNEKSIYDELESYSWLLLALAVTNAESITELFDTLDLDENLIRALHALRGQQNRVIYPRI